jgi:hypothetical protein
MNDEERAAILANDLSGLVELRRRRALIQEVQSNRKQAITDKMLATVQARMEEIATKGVARD